MTIRRLTAGGLLAGLAALLLIVLPAPSANAASGTYLRLAHLSPDTPTVDVLVTSFSGATVTLAGVSYGDVSTYTRIEPGRHTVQMRQAGAPPSSPAILTGTLDAQEGQAYTAAGLGPRAGLALSVLTDDLNRPGSNQAKVRVVQGAEQAGRVAVRWNAVPLVDGVAFGSATAYATVPAGTGAFDVVPASGAPVGVPVRLAGGGVYSVILVQRNGALVGEVRTDALGPTDTPSGGIETGFGGTADQRPSRSALIAGMSFAVVLGGLALIALQRRTRRRHR